MNKTLAILSAVHGAGGIIRAVEGKLKISALEPLPENLMNEIKNAKPELLAIFATIPPGLESSWQELFEERAAIMEFDGGLSRKEAEKEAFNNVSAAN